MTSPRTITPARPSHLFPGFFFGGFECSTPINRDGQRIDELALTGHDLYLRQDYRDLRAVGIHTVRDGVRWDRVDRRGRLDFSSALPYVEAAEAEGVTVIWDLFHYGYPDDLDPFEEPFIERFAAYCRAFARLLVRRGYAEDGPNAAGRRFYTPVNEISYFAWAGGDEGIFAPHAQGRGAEMKRRLVRAAIAGMDAIREVDSLARFVNCDPLVRVVAPLDAPWLEGEANYFNEHFVCEAWDMLAGRIEPELGGSPAHLDILGVNYYGLNQWEHQRMNVLAEDDPRRAPFSRMLRDLYARYEHPMIVAETSSRDDDRSRWLEMIADECCDAMQHGVDLHGICIYPIVGMAEWHDGSFISMGLWDRAEPGRHDRSVCAPMYEALRRLQRTHVADIDSAVARPLAVRTTHAASDARASSGSRRESARRIAA